jgi:hypothetical protein
MPERDVLFPLGRLIATPGALQALDTSGESPIIYLTRHLHGDWGDLTEDDKQGRRRDPDPHPECLSPKGWDEDLDHHRSRPEFDVHTVAE